MKLARRSPRGYGFDLGSGDRLRLYLRRPLQYIAIPTMALADDKLTPPQRRLEPLAPLHLAPQHRLEPQLHGALQHGAKLRNAILGAASRATPENAVSRATAVAATPAQHASFEKLQGPRSSATLRAEEKTPRAAVRKPHQLQTNFNLNTSNVDRGPRHLGRNAAARPQPRDAELYCAVTEGYPFGGPLKL